jgi:hypothetical protein
MRALIVLALSLVPVVVTAADATPEQIEFFEKRVRPVLVRSCYSCHSSAVAQPMGNVRVDTKEGLSAVSSRMGDAVSYKSKVKMPPSGKLPDEQIADIAAWVKMGAPSYPDAKAGGGKNHWAFQPVKDPAVPPVRNKEWVRSPVDAFVLSKLEQRNLEPAPPAEKRDLIRRATFDLIGLPPEPGDVDAFLADNSPDAFKRVVDRLLESPHYGERWARHWLDLVRYAETNGHEYDNDKPAPWRYRDYVIRAFNQDLPYNQFVREHLAGDLLPRKRFTADGAYEESALGTGFLWFGEVLNSTTDPVKSRADEVDNQIDVVGKAFLGLTVACARCHDHKFDPIPTADYYRFAGVLHSTEMMERVIDSPERTAVIRKLGAEILSINEEIESIKKTAKPRQPSYSYRPEDSVFDSFDQGFGKWNISGAAFGSAPVNESATSSAAGSDVFVGTLTSPKFKTTDKLFLHVRISGSKGDPKLNERGPLRFTIVNDRFKSQHIVPEGVAGSKWKTLRLTFERNRICYFEIVDHSRDGSISVDEIVFSDSKEPPPVVEPPPVTPRLLGTQQNEAIRELEVKRAHLESQVPESAFAAVATDYQPHNVKVHLRGSHTNLGDEVPRGFLKLVAGDKNEALRGSGRQEVAEWVSSTQDPLLARVMANRIWKHHFGRGIVKSPDNFGLMGDPPSHPELLDYLASRFVEKNWSVKSLHRLIVLSSAYQMSSTAPAKAKEADPENQLVHHMPVQRLEAEAIRDALLSVSGSLKPDLFGPSVVPYISKYQDGRGKPVSGPLDGNGRRSLYIQVRRNFLSPMFLAFDYPLPISSMGARSVSTVPSQALLLLNNEFVAQQAERWGAKVMSATSDPVERVRLMYRTAFAREPEQRESEEILAFTKTPAASAEPTAERKVWADIAHVLINSPEFIYVR